METRLNGFDEFWAIYPRHVAKQAAVKSYKRALKQTTPGRIIGSAKKYAEERAGKDPQFTAHASTWLNAGRWDDFQPERAKPSSQSAVGYYADFCSAELDAWNAYGRRTTGMSYPADKRGGWTFPTQWPPGHEKAA